MLKTENMRTDKPSEDMYIRFECVNFECDVNPVGYYIMSISDTEMPPPRCQHCGSPMVREDTMVTNTLLWELGIEVRD